MKTQKHVQPTLSDLEALDYYIDLADEGARDFDPEDPERTSEYAQYPAELAALERIRDYLTEHLAESEFAPGGCEAVG